MEPRTGEIVPANFTSPETCAPLGVCARQGMRKKRGHANDAQCSKGCRVGTGLSQARP